MGLEVERGQVVALRGRLRELWTVTKAVGDLLFLERVESASTRTKVVKTSEVIWLGW